METQRTYDGSSPTQLGPGITQGSGDRSRTLGATMGLGLHLKWGLTQGCGNDTRALCDSGGPLWDLEPLLEPGN